MAILEVKEQRDGDGSVVRRIYLQPELLLHTRIDNLDHITRFPAVGMRAESCITWPLEHDVSLRQHLNAAEVLFAGYQMSEYPRVVEAWIDGSHHKAPYAFGRQRLTNDVLGFIASRKYKADQKLDLLFVACGDLALEWTFGPNPDSPLQCSCACTIIISEHMARFFRAFHRDGRVRSQGEISQDIFANTANPPLNAFLPLQVIVT